MGWTRDTAAVCWPSCNRRYQRGRGGQRRDCAGSSCCWGDLTYIAAASILAVTSHLPVETARSPFLMVFKDSVNYVEKWHNLHWLDAVSYSLNFNLSILLLLFVAGICLITDGGDHTGDSTTKMRVQQQVRGWSWLYLPRLRSHPPRPQHYGGTLIVITAETTANYELHSEHGMNGKGWELGWWWWMWLGTSASNVPSEGS